MVWVVVLLFFPDGLKWVLLRQARPLGFSIVRGVLKSCRLGVFVFLAFSAAFLSFVSADTEEDLCI